MQIQTRKFERTKVEVNELGIGGATFGGNFTCVDRGEGLVRGNLVEAGRGRPAFRDDKTQSISLFQN